MPVSKEEYIRVGAVKTACADGVDDIRLILAHRELMLPLTLSMVIKPAHPRAQGAYLGVVTINNQPIGLILAHRELMSLLGSIATMRQAHPRAQGAYTS